TSTSALLQKIAARTFKGLSAGNNAMVIMTYQSKADTATGVVKVEMSTLTIFPELQKLDGRVVSITTFAEGWNLAGDRIFASDVPTNVAILDPTQGPFRFRVWRGEDCIDFHFAPQQGEHGYRYVRFIEIQESQGLSEWSMDMNLRVTSKKQYSDTTMTNPAGNFKKLLLTVEITHKQPDMIPGVRVKTWNVTIADPNPSKIGVLVFQTEYPVDLTWSQNEKVEFTFQTGPSTNEAGLLQIKGWYQN
ncbi:MAG: hypothetical protein AB1352_03405, partial [Patescibacteria group bacterium]